MGLGPAADDGAVAVVDDVEADAVDLSLDAFDTRSDSFSSSSLSADTVGLLLAFGLAAAAASGFLNPFIPDSDFFNINN